MNILRRGLRGRDIEVPTFSAALAQRDGTPRESLAAYEHDINRAKWGSKTEFVLSLIGYAVGIGNVWRFPYLCYRSGGGAFLIPYLLMLFLCGIPVFFMEICIGQFSSTGCTGMFRLTPLFKGAGIAIIIVNLITACYYSVIITYPVRFLVTLCYAKNLPWDSCDNSWNTDKCAPIQDQRNSTENLKTPADEYFHREILQISSGIEELGTIIWPLFGCLCFTWVVIYICISKGIHSVGKVVYFTATFPYVVLIILFVRGVTLPGASDGILYYVTPQWSKLKDLKTWADAAIQIFFSLGPGWGGIVNMASFNNFHNNALIDAYIIPIVNCGTSIFAGFVVFSVLGFLSIKSGRDISNVAVDGPSLAFVTYPEAIALLPLPRLWGILFFIMLFLLGLDSVFVQIEAVQGSIFDEFPKIRKYKVWFTLVICTLLLGSSMIMTTNAGMYILSLLDWYTASIAIIMVCILEVIMVSYVYGINNFMFDVSFMLAKHVSKMWKILWAFVTPMVLIFIFFTSIFFNRRITYNKMPYPDWSIVLGWTVCASSLIWIPAYMVYVTACKPGTCKDNFKLYGSTADWTPANPTIRDDYEEAKKIHQEEMKLKATSKGDKDKNKDQNDKDKSKDKSKDKDKDRSKEKDKDKPKDKDKDKSKDKDKDKPKDKDKDKGKSKDKDKEQDKSRDKEKDQNPPEGRKSKS